MDDDSAIVENSRTPGVVQGAGDRECGVSYGKASGVGQRADGGEGAIEYLEVAVARVVGERVDLVEDGSRTVEFDEPIVGDNAPAAEGKRGGLAVLAEAT